MKDPLFNWSDKRSSGVLMHPTSLPSAYAIGSFGASSRAFVDAMKSCGFHYWQMLPIGPTGYGDSPYQSYSSFAINPLLLDWDDLQSRGWITAQELAPIRCDTFASNVVNFDHLKPIHARLRRNAFEKALNQKALFVDYETFKKENSWLQAYSLFTALKKKYAGKPWIEWKKEDRSFSNASQADLDPAIEREKEIICYEQFILFRQWFELKAYANHSGMQLIGDIPIYVSPDSSDIWADIEVFKTTKTGKLSSLAGVPPDYFNEDGQFWGNPLYNWEYLKSTNYDWWIERMKHTLSLFDVVRFDHFRALAAYWSIPGKATSAKEGRWIKGPGISFFEALKKRLPEAKIIIEDLGDITPDVIELKNATGFPGLAVLQFAWDQNSGNFYLPHNIEPNTVVYTGTHDNDTSAGWYASAPESSKDQLRKYLRVSGDEACWDLIRAAFSSVANICIIPVQDLLSLDSGSRMNTPGFALGNWKWRMQGFEQHQIQNESAEYLRMLADLYGRD